METLLTAAMFCLSVFCFLWFVAQEEGCVIQAISVAPRGPAPFLFHFSWMLKNKNVEIQGLPKRPYHPHQQSWLVRLAVSLDISVETTLVWRCPALILFCKELLTAGKLSLRLLKL